jgi:hypothetical protein
MPLSEDKMAEIIVDHVLSIYDLPRDGSSKPDNRDAYGELRLYAIRRTAESLRLNRSV